MRVVAASVAAAFCFLGNDAVLARDLDGRDAVIDETYTREGWNLTNGATLTVNGKPGAYAEADYINVNSRSQLTAESLRIVGSSAASPNRALVFVGLGAKAYLSNSYIESTDSVAVWLNRGVIGESDPAEVVISSSIIKGVGTAIIASSGGSIDIYDTHVSASEGATPEDGWDSGLRVSDAKANVVNSIIEGADHGILMATERDAAYPGAFVTLASTKVTGEKGAAIRVDRIEDRGVARDFTLAITNGSTLIGGNGKIIEVGHESDTGAHLGFKLTVDNSQLVGDIDIADFVDSDVTLSNYGSVTGRLIGVDHLTLADSGEWKMIESSQIDKITMSDGIVDIHGTAAEGTYHTLEVGSLSGEGTFKMQTNIAGGQGDVLKLKGDSSGNFALKVRNTGAEPSANGQHLLVDGDVGDAAEFSLVGGGVGVGAFMHRLEKIGDDWLLVRGTQASPGTDAVVGIMSAEPTVWYGEATTLRGRMGEMRLAESPEGGVWARTFGGKYNARPSVGYGYTQNQWGVMAGADHVVGRSATGTWLVGAMAGTSTSNLGFAIGSSGTVQSYTAGMYATWLGKNGYYFDGMLKYNHFKSDLDVRMTDGERVKGGYGTNGLGLSAEFGRKMDLSGNWFVEPYAQVSALWVGGNDFELDGELGNMKASAARTGSVQASLGVSVGKTFETSKGTFQPYVRAAVTQEFVKSNAVMINNVHSMSNDLSGTRLELAAGMSAQMQKNLNVYGDVNYSLGKKLDKPWGVNVGVRLSF